MMGTPSLTSLNAVMGTPLLTSFLSTSSILLVLGGVTQMSVPALLNLEPSITL